MIQTSATLFTRYMMRKGLCEDDFEVHRYGIEVILSTIIDLSLILFVGSISGMLMEAILFYFGFWIIRKYSGGYHCKTYFNCISLHVLTFMAFTLTVALFQNFYIKAITCMIGIGTFLWLSPIKNRKFTRLSYSKYKRISLIILLLYILLSFSTFYGEIFSYLILSVSVYMLVCITINYEKV